VRCFKGYRFKSAWSKRNGIAKVNQPFRLLLSASESVRKVLDMLLMSLSLPF
jgi:hypothetical protein